MATRRRYPRTFREHPAVVVRRNVAAISAFVPADGEQRARFERDFPAEKLPALPKKRGPAGRSDRPLERNVLKAVIHALRADPRVSRVERNQSGVFQEGGRIIRVGSKGKLDLTVYLVSGKYAEIEVKRDSRTAPRPEQWARIESIRRAGGIAGYCWDIPSALALLPT